MAAVRHVDALGPDAGDANDTPLVAHVVNGLRAGGLENGLVNLINRLPAEHCRHAIICLTDHDDFARRIDDENVPVIDLNKRPGKDLAWYGRCWRVLRSLRPDIVHTRNLATIEAQVVAALAGVPGRVHGEHGWDMYDLHGSNRKYRLLRRLCSPFIQTFIPLSTELERYLLDGVRVAPAKVQRICNGVDVRVFSPREGARPVELPGLAPDDVVIGSVGRMEPVKDPLNLVEAFISATARDTLFAERARLAMVGGGSLRAHAEARLAEAGLAARAWLPGHRDDIADCLRSFDVFALPSKAEGISNTILEAMATGLPVVATRVGGNAELVQEGANAALVPAEDSEAMGSALRHYVQDSAMRESHGRRSREIAVSRFSIEQMVESYWQVYRQRLYRRPESTRSPASGNEE